MKRVTLALRRAQAQRHVAEVAPHLRAVRSFSTATATTSPAPASFLKQMRFCSVEPSRTNVRLRNVGVIAHVDHGKTTLVDALLGQSGAVKIKEETRVMDSNEIEKERGITILAKNTCVELSQNTINIVDTPGHSDFAGEVERALQMLEGFILLVDAAEGPKPGTRYVLRKALELDLKPIVVINKVDRTTIANIESTRDSIESLFLELATNDDQLDYPVLYGSGRSGYMSTDINQREGTLQPLFDTIIETVPPPTETQPGVTQAQITSIEVKGKGKKFYTLRMRSGGLKLKDEVVATDFHQPGKALFTFKVQALSKFQGLERIPSESAYFGDIVLLSGDNVDKLALEVGHTLCLKNTNHPLPYKALDPPTFMVTLHPNRSPLAGRDGTKFGGPEVRERLVEEAVRNLAMKLEVCTVWTLQTILKGIGFELMGCFVSHFFFFNF